MNHSHRLQQLFEQAYQRHVKADAPSATSLIPFLAIPIQERLILLALLDGATLPEIKVAFPFAKETDIRKVSKRMIAAEDQLMAAIEDPWCWLWPGFERVDETGDLTDPETPFPVPSFTIPPGTDVQLRQIFYGSSALMLFGEAVPTVIARLSLQQRSVLYCLAVEALSWQDVKTVLGCTEWKIRRAIKDAEEALGGL
jgi:hypothetical protein